jgi:hypothetical protein
VISRQNSSSIQSESGRNPTHLNFLGSAGISAMTNDKQSESQALEQNNDPTPQRTLTEDDIHELISFFQLPRKWDREAKALESSKPTKETP